MSLFIILKIVFYPSNDFNIIVDFQFILINSYHFYKILVFKFNIYLSHLIISQFIIFKMIIYPSTDLSIIKKFIPINFYYCRYLL